MCEMGLTHRVAPVDFARQTVLESPARLGIELEQRMDAGPPKIAIDKRLSDEYTVIEVKCPDRLGLLHLITRTLSALDLDIASARIATEIDQALDTFYVLDRKGRRLEEPAAIDRVRSALEQALRQPI